MSTELCLESLLSPFVNSAGEEAEEVAEKELHCDWAQISENDFSFSVCKMVPTEKLLKLSEISTADAAVAVIFPYFSLNPCITWDTELWVLSLEVFFNFVSGLTQTHPLMHVCSGPPSLRLARRTPPASSLQQVKPTTQQHPATSQLTQCAHDVIGPLATAWQRGDNSKHQSNCDEIATDWGLCLWLWCCWLGMVEEGELIRCFRSV